MEQTEKVMVEIDKAELIAYISAGVFVFGLIDENRRASHLKAIESVDDTEGVRRMLGVFNAALDAVESFNKLGIGIQPVFLTAIRDAMQRRSDAAKIELPPELLAAISLTASGCVYVIKAVGTELYKIGMSTDFTKRLKNIKHGLPYEIEVVCQIGTSEPRNLERYFHEMFKLKRAKHEWFRLSEADVFALKELIEVAPV